MGSLKYLPSLISNASQKEIGSKLNQKSVLSGTCLPIFWLCSMLKAKNIKIKRIHKEMIRVNKIHKLTPIIKSNKNMIPKKVMYGHWVLFYIKCFMARSHTMGNLFKRWLKKSDSKNWIFQVTFIFLLIRVWTSMFPNNFKSL